MGVRLVLRSALSKAAPPDVTYDFDQARIVIGRGTGADVRIPHRSVSEAHATIHLQGNRYVIVDHGATNGTYVDGHQLVPERPKPLASGDEIACGGFVLAFQAGVATIAQTSAERTASLARRLVREVLYVDEEASAPPRMEVDAGPDAGTQYALPPPPASVVAGRGSDCNWVLADEALAESHLELVRDVDGVVARALGEHPVQCGDRPMRERRLRHGDILILGHTHMRFEDPAERAMQALIGEPDVAEPFTATLATPSDAEPPPEADDADESAPESAEAPPPSPAPSPDARTRGVRFAPDVLVYLLAALVLGLSIAGLMVVLQAD